MSDEKIITHSETTTPEEAVSKLTPEEKLDFLQLKLEQAELKATEKNIALIRYLKTHPWFGVKYSIFSKDGQAKKDLTEFENVEKALELIKESDELKVQAISMAIFGLSSFNKSYTQCAAELKAKFEEAGATIELK